MSTIIEQPRFSCALAAQQTVLAIPRGIPIIHAGPGCSSKAFSYASYGSGFQGEGYAGGAMVSCTNSGEQEVVFGGEGKLKDVVEGALKVLDGDLYVILTGCTAGIIGDDPINVAKKFMLEGKPVIGVETAGFKGNNYLGHELVVNEIIEQYLGDAEPKIEKGLVNVFSVVPYQNPFWRGDLEEIKELLEKIGLKVNILYGCSSLGIKEWDDIPNAQFNILLSPWVGLETVKLLEKKYGTPYMYYPVFPIGAKETGSFLREAGRFAGLPESVTEQVILREKERYYTYFTGMADFISDYRGNLPFDLFTVADSIYAVGISNYLVNELGFLPKGIYITDEPGEERMSEIEKVLLNMGNEFAGSYTFEADGGKIEADIRSKIKQSRRTLILGSSWEKFLAEETGNTHAYISLPINDSLILNRSYVGYDGGLRLLEEIYSSSLRRNVTSSRTQSYA